MIDIDALANEIRRVDGNHDKGAGALAEALMPFLTAALSAAPEAVRVKEVVYRRSVDDEAEILRRLADGDTIVFSMDGDMAWFTKGDRAFVGDTIMSLREKGYLHRKRYTVDDEDDPRGIAFYDTISEAGRAALTTTEGKDNA